ncbi:MAG TPA: Holliday junction branch migration protein RuvA [Oscillatoriaceae cyanobacterium M33_DOE_052]|uniref:Holliday junction branch migration complex subunit RuvA n=1 Tax=Planktothricoides sp. SpSt-374 TaxID=2282167 RepID=A0A7C3VG26_9CYAN|nr:Holliday junction branch migration protein RuvA [Oscillatoriaceae cyanobacterium M33_DOE_052]
MLSYLKGTMVGVQRQGNRTLLILEVNQVGCEVQIPSRLVAELPEVGEPVQVFAHLQVREDQWVVYGFASSAARDLFRQLISVSGIGAQLAIALLDTLALPDLVQAIVTSNHQVLAKTPGVGKKTAERIALELRTKLAQWQERAFTPTPGIPPQLQEDIEMTLFALGYNAQEVMNALAAVGRDPNLSPDTDAGEWIKRAIAWLSHN